MQNLKSSGAIAVLAIFLASPAIAADATEKGSTYGLPSVQAPSGVVNWSGIWVGGTVGWGNANHNVTVEETYKGDTYELLNFDGINSSGAVYGLEAGADLSRGGWLFGVLGGYDWTNMSTELSVFNNAFGCELSNEGQWFAGARVGRVISSRVMVYSMAAYTQAEYELGCSGLDENPSETYSGLRLGVGGEYALDNGLFLNARYTHDFFGDVDWINEDGFKVTDSLDQDIVKLGVSFKFGGSLDALR